MKPDEYVVHAGRRRQSNAATSFSGYLDPNRSKRRLCFLCLLLFSCGWVRCSGAAERDSANPPIAIRFKLDQPGFVTLVIDDANRKRVRNLISETPFPAGENAVP